ncbi:MAG: glycosyltransferase family 2 protein [Candidatus Omnitrophica bacterium]|nr:glycosyltransferase family 2 protein [Candidatus Omnitrophota bacterium]
MAQTNPLISFIIPVYNEEKNIVGVFRDLYEVIRKNPTWRTEVIVIEDGSKDRTLEVIRELLHEYPQTRLIEHSLNQGYCRSMRDGIRAAQGDYLMYIGADEEFDCSEVPSFVNPLLADGEEHADVVLGVRWQRNAYKLHRFFISVIYIFLLNAMFKLRVNDYNWSQVWSRDLLNSIEIRSKSLFMLPEIIIKAYDLGYKVKEVPSNHRGRRWGKSSLNMKIMGYALLDSLRFWVSRSRPSYNARRSSAAEIIAADS